MTCYLKRDIVEKEYQTGKISEQTYKDLIKQMEMHEKLYHSPENEEAKPKKKVEMLA